MTYFTDSKHFKNLYWTINDPEETQKCEKEEQSMRDHNTWYQTILLGHCNQNSLSSWHKNRHIYQYNKIESPEINPCLYGQYLMKETRVYNGIKTTSSRNGVWRTVGRCKKMKLDHNLTPYTKINSRWIKVLHLSWHNKSPRVEHRQENLRCSMQK